MDSSEVGEISVLALSLLNTDPRPAIPPESWVRGAELPLTVGPLGSCFTPWTLGFFMRQR